VHVQLCCTLIGGGYSNDSNVLGAINIYVIIHISIGGAGLPVVSVVSEPTKRQLLQSTHWDHVCDSRRVSR